MCFVRVAWWLTLVVLDITLKPEQPGEENSARGHITARLPTNQVSTCTLVGLLPPR